MTNTAEIFKLIQQHDGDPRMPSTEAIRSELERILHSRTFHRAKRLRSLLDYVVTAATKGQPTGEMQTARDLFGKDDGFDPALDPVIRVQFGRLRRTLAHYYSTEGTKDSITIQIPSRRYTPTFQDNFHSNGKVDLQPMSAMSDEDRAEAGRAAIAVLPFTNLTSDPAQDAFCCGITEEIANGLAAVEHVDVVASSSTLQFKDERLDVREVGWELGVPLVLDGSVRMEDGRTRVIAQLARSRDGIAVWSDSFDDTVNGSLDAQKSIAQRVVDNLPLDRAK